MTVFNFESGITVDTGKIPEASVNALIARGINHVFGNETASKVVSAIRSRINPEKPKEVSTDAVKVWRQANADAAAELTRSAHEGFAKALVDGTMGLRTLSGPKTDPLTRHMRQSASAEIVAILRERGAIAQGERKTPAGDTEFSIGGQTVTFGALVDRRLANPKERPRLKKDAEQHLAALARQKARVEANAKEAAQGTSLEDMGL